MIYSPEIHTCASISSEFQSRDYQGRYPDKLLFQFNIGNTNMVYFFVHKLRLVLLAHHPHFGDGTDVFSTSHKIVAKSSFTLAYFEGCANTAFPSFSINLLAALLPEISQTNEK